MGYFAHEFEFEFLGHDWIPIEQSVIMGPGLLSPPPPVIVNHPSRVSISRRLTRIRCNKCKHARTITLYNLGPNLPYMYQHPFATLVPFDELFTYLPCEYKSLCCT